jgi:hypothetical protein
MSLLQRYQSFSSPELAQPLLALLEEKRIAYDTAHLPESFNAALGLTMPAVFEVKLLPGDFEKVRALETEANRAQLAEVDREHYLFGFSDAELYEVLAKADEWSAFDVALAEHILQERGLDVTPEEAQLLRQYRVAELSRPANSAMVWVLAGYASAAAGGVLSFFIALHLLHHKLLPNGQQVPAFSEADRKHGRQILALSGLSITVWLLLYAWNKLGGA